MKTSPVPFFTDLLDGSGGEMKILRRKNNASIDRSGERVLFWNWIGVSRSLFAGGFTSPGLLAAAR